MAALSERYSNHSFFFKPCRLKFAGLLERNSHFVARSIWTRFLLFHLQTWTHTHRQGVLTSDLQAATILPASFPVTNTGLQTKLSSASWPASPARNGTGQGPRTSWSTCGACCQPASSSVRAASVFFLGTGSWLQGSVTYRNWVMAKADRGRCCFCPTLSHNFCVYCKTSFSSFFSLARRAFSLRASDCSCKAFSFIFSVFLAWMASISTRLFL